MAAELFGEAVDVEPELAGVARSGREAQGVLVGEQEIVHLPERALRGRRLGRLGGELGMRVNVGERKVAPDVAEVAEVREQLADDRLGLPAERALEVAVLDERDRGVLGAADVVALGVDGNGEVDDRLRRSRGAPGSSRRGSELRRAEEEPGRTEEQTAALRTPSFASSSGSPWKARAAIRSDTVKPMPAMGPPPATAAQPTGGRSRPRLSFVTSQEAETMPIGLPTT